MTSFTWKNCWADIHAVFHGRTVAAYLSDVVEPAILALERKVSALGQSTEAWAPFDKADMETLHVETMKAFALAIQSLWERQLRDYVFSCATELKLDGKVLADARANPWTRVEDAFLAARSICLGDFPSYAVLNALQLLGNVCRHGEGASVAKLYALRPDFWPDLSVFLIDPSPEPIRPSASLIRITPDHLRVCTGAITDFWEDAHTIYLESIKAKHDNVVAELEQRRAAGRWFPDKVQQATAHGGR